MRSIQSPYSKATELSRSLNSKCVQLWKTQFITLMIWNNPKETVLYSFVQWMAICFQIEAK